MAYRELKFNSGMGTDRTMTVTLFDDGMVGFYSPKGTVISAEDATKLSNLISSQQTFSKQMDTVRRIKEFFKNQ